MKHVYRGILCGALFLAAGTASAELPGFYSTVTYNVADLIVPLDNYTLPVIKLWKQRHPDKARTPPGPEEALIDLIKETIAVESWSDKDGQAMIQYYPLGLGLVVNQTPEVHKEIREKLKSLTGMMRELCFESTLIQTGKDGQQIQRQLPKVTFFDEQGVHIQITDDHWLTITIRTQIKADGTVGVWLHYADWGVVDLRPGSEFCPFKDEVFRIVKLGKTMRVPVEKGSAGEVRTWLVFTLQEIPREEDEQDFVGSLTPIPR